MKRRAHNAQQTRKSRSCVDLAVHNTYRLANVYGITLIAYTVHWPGARRGQHQFLWDHERARLDEKWLRVRVPYRSHRRCVFRPALRCGVPLNNLKTICLWQDFIRKALRSSAIMRKTVTRRLGRHRAYQAMRKCSKHIQAYLVIIIRALS